MSLSASFGYVSFFVWDVFGCDTASIVEPCDLFLLLFFSCLPAIKMFIPKVDGVITRFQYTKLHLLYSYKTTSVVIVTFKLKWMQMGNRE